MRWFALLTLIGLSAAGWGGSAEHQSEVTGTIAFTRASQLWVMNVDGSGQRMLARGGAPVWSPDGRRITYLLPRRNAGAHLVVVNADGSGARRLTRPERNYEIDLDPVWSPDGRRIAFTRYDSDPNYAVYVVTVGGGGERRLTPGWEFAGPTWAPGGRKLALNHVHRGAVYIVRADGSGRRVLGAPEGASRTWGVRWSPDGRLIAFISDDLLWVMNADGTSPRKLLEGRVDNRGARNADYAWSPDSRQIAFAHGDGRGFKEISAVNADGTDLRRLTNNTRMHDLQPVWSPDARTIAFTTDRDGNTEIYVMNADGTDQRNVSNSPTLSDYSPAWSPTS